MAGTQILDKDQILQKIRRIAYHIHENHYLEQELVLAGIQDSGYALAELIAAELERISSFALCKISLQIDKEVQMQPEVAIRPILPNLANKVVILVDDVLNSGRTLAFALKPFLEQPCKKIEVAVLVNRAHKRYPISVDYTGYELATTLNEHIKVDLDSDRMSVTLE